MRPSASAFRDELPPAEVRRIAPSRLFGLLACVIALLFPAAPLLVGSGTLANWRVPVEEHESSAQPGSSEAATSERRVSLVPRPRKTAGHSIATRQMSAFSADRAFSIDGHRYANGLCAPLRC